MFSQNPPLWLRFPAISPYGDEIAFCYQGNIYKVSADGGEAEQLTTDNYYSFKPVWSPCGEYIAYASNKFGNYDIFLMESNGKNQKRITFISKHDIPFTFSNCGEYIYYRKHFLYHHNCVVNPVFYHQVYKISTQTGHISQVFSLPAEDAFLNKNNNLILFHDVKGHYCNYRKHDISPAARDIWSYNLNTESFKKLTDFEGEDRNPLLNNTDDTVFYLSEQFNSNFNICKFPLDNPKDISQVTFHKNHPVRFLTISNNNDLCYSYNGEIYLKKENKETQKVNIIISTNELEDDIEYKVFSSGVSEYAISPNGNEIAFIVRGKIFVTSINSDTTIQLTKTNEIERDVSFSPDGKAIIYSSQKNGAWNIYQTKIVNKNDTSFIDAVSLQEEEILTTNNSELGPKFSPDGNYIAYWENRTKLMLYNLKTKDKKELLENHKSFIYADNIQLFEWSPDSKWILFNYSPRFMFSNEVGIVNITGNPTIINITQSGYNDIMPKWSKDGKMFIWFTERDGYRDHASVRAQRDLYAAFFSKEDFEIFNLTQEEYQLYKESDISKNLNENIFDFEKIKYRQVRLTNNSSSLSDAVLSNDGETLYYMSRFEAGFDLWTKNLRLNKTELALKLTGRSGNLKIDNRGENLYFLLNGHINKVDLSNYKNDIINFRAERLLNYNAEREIVFEDLYLQMKERFYVENLHNTNWLFYKNEYKKFIPHINNDIDFAEMLSEMMGELNVSHSGVTFTFSSALRESTACLAFFPDYDYTEKGVKIAEIIENGPLNHSKSRIKNNCIIKKIDDNEVENLNHYFYLMNNKANKYITLTVYNPENKKRWTENIKPINTVQENILIYDRWISIQEQKTDILSNGRLGYVHLKGFGVTQFRNLYSDVLGKYYDKGAIIIDIRTSSGGWIHDDLITFFSGEKYADFYFRDNFLGAESSNRWLKKSILLINENGRSDASGFAHFYKDLNIGKIVGMPNQGTFTAILRINTLIPRMSYYVPHVGAKNLDNQFIENLQLQPDYEIRNDYEMLIKGIDQQLEKTIEIMLNDLQ